ncbi:hypothetical protein [Flavisphingomonas formosensis]|uniref:hypothetical protein n=1 Tax=Flavisphingomonas formosensis TaxID=861534 RepID=UPI0018DEFFC6|nr:hypothetical protein [Sphingomonas formosensis]
MGVMLAPLPFQHAESEIVERNAEGVAILRIAMLDRRHAAKRIDRSHITTAKAYRLSFDTITGGPKWAQTPLPGGALSIHR